VRYFSRRYGNSNRELSPHPFMSVPGGHKVLRSDKFSAERGGRHEKT
jgi:hypothetical protein